MNYFIVNFFHPPKYLIPVSLIKGFLKVVTADKLFFFDSLELFGQFELT